MDWQTRCSFFLIKRVGKWNGYDRNKITKSSNKYISEATSIEATLWVKI